MDTKQQNQGSLQANKIFRTFNKHDLSYADLFTNPIKRYLVRTIEFFTGKIRLIYLVKQLEREGLNNDQTMCAQALRIMGVEIKVPEDQIQHIPKSGPVIVVANHPCGLVEGMVLAELVGRARPDYKILSRAILTRVEETKRFCLPIPFPYEKDAHANNIDMRSKAM